MALALRFDDDHEEPLATNSGWGDFVRWSEHAPPDRFAELRHFTAYGWCQNPRRLQAEIQGAAKELGGMSPQNQNTIANLIWMLGRASETVVVSNGMESG